MTVSRRRTLKLAASAAIAPLVAGCASPSPPASAQVPPAAGAASEAELEQMALDVMVGEEAALSDTFNFESYKVDKDLRSVLTKDRVVPALQGKRLSKTGERLGALSVADADSPNYNHLGVPKSEDVFKLNAGVLARTAVANGFEESFGRALGGTQAQARIVIFGLRGCRLAAGAVAGAMADEVQLVEATIDHLGKNCVMGVWDRQTGKISAFTASTAPHLVYMQMYRINLHLLGKIQLDDATVNADDVISEEEKETRKLPWTANMLGQGLHLMSVGKHQGKYDNLLVQHKSWYGPVLRAQRSLGYTVSDWDMARSRVGDNIHPTWPVAGWLMDFASAGCNLIEGKSKDAPDYDGPFATFLTQIKQPADGLGIEGDWKTYHYMLLSGREARLHSLSDTPNPSLRRLKFGSSGSDVVDLQTRLVGMSTVQAKGVFDLDTHFRVLTWQKGRRLATDGVITPDHLKT